MSKTREMVDQLSDIDLMDILRENNVPVSASRTELVTQVEGLGEGVIRVHLAKKNPALQDLLLAFERFMKHAEPLTRQPGCSSNQQVAGEKREIQKTISPNQKALMQERNNQSDGTKQDELARNVGLPPEVVETKD